MQKGIRYVRSDIEDLALTNRFSRGSDVKNAEDSDVVLSTTLPKDLGCG
jgi:hypothetical protein